MIPLTSTIEHSKHEFDTIKQQLAQHQFTLGGNWEYGGGSFDCALDENNKVWLRLPFTVAEGNIDSEDSRTDANIIMGQPYVLKHLYNEGLDHDASANVVVGLVNQFQKPTNPDAEIEDEWTERALQKLRLVEETFPL